MSKRELKIILQEILFVEKEVVFYAVLKCLEKSAKL